MIKKIEKKKVYGNDEQWACFPKQNYTLDFNGSMSIIVDEDIIKPSSFKTAWSLGKGETQPEPDDGSINQDYKYSLYNNNKKTKKEGYIKIIENNEVVVKNVSPKAKVCLVCGKKFPNPSGKQTACKACKPGISAYKKSEHNKSIAQIKTSVGKVTPFAWKVHNEFKTPTCDMPEQNENTNDNSKIHAYNKYTGKKMYNTKSTLYSANMKKDEVVDYIVEEIGTKPSKYTIWSKTKVLGDALIKDNKAEKIKPKGVKPDYVGQEACECGGTEFKIMTSIWEKGTAKDKVCTKCGLVQEDIPLSFAPDKNTNAYGDVQKD